MNEREIQKHGQSPSAILQQNKRDDARLSFIKKESSLFFCANAQIQNSQQPSARFEIKICLYFILTTLAHLKRKPVTKRMITLLLLLNFIFAFSQKDGPVFTYKIISSVENTFGYDIYKDERLIIHQPNIPSLQGEQGFKTKSDAEKVALLAIQKIEKGIMPPTITEKEVKNIITKN